MNLRFGKRGRKSECNHTRPGSDIQNLGLRIWNFGFEELNEFLRLRSRNHRALIAKKCVAAKFHRAEQMLEWLALAAPPNQLAQRGQFAFAEILFELEIKFHARASEHMCEQVLGVQARIVDVALLKIRGHGLQYLEDGHSLINGGTRTVGPMNYGADVAAPSTTPPRRSLTSAACNALIISPRSPSITRSRS